MKSAKLAENSANQTRSIKAQLANITSIISQVVSTSEASVEGFVQITNKVSSTENIVREINSAMAEQEEASRQVLASLRDINETSVQVQQTSQKMAGDMSSLQNSAQELDIISETVENSMSEMSKGIQEINQTGQTIAAQSMRARGSVQQLESMLEKFKIET